MGKCHWWPMLLSGTIDIESNILIAQIVALVVAGITVAVTYYTKTGVFAPKSDTNSSNTNATTPNSTNATNSTNMTSCPLRGMYLDSKKKCQVCPQPNKTFAVFWQSHTDGCRDFMKTPAFQYVTHIYWGFALINNQTGAVGQTFQGNDATLLDCANAMKSKCVQQYASIGGATERTNFIALNTPDKVALFGKTAATLVEKFGFDGVDIDDESGNSLAGGDWNATSSANVVAYLQSIRTSLNALPLKAGEPAYRITWDEFPTSLDANCAAPGGDYQRCFNAAIGQSVDQVNVMMYNSETSAAYDTFLNATVPTNWAAVVAPSKIVLGGCVGKPGDEGACSYGASPSSAQLARYASDGSSKYGGTMLWTGSADYTLNKGQTMVSMGQAGGYGVQVPSS
ncbi:Aste57867_15166 [Aphanomyces stellatus]|uniref:Aste57867_15166 protein n=1 Tax=Aphanomyces stellatus TaxID=120398 RepID=A0A485L4B9_9STRA|nr:hypothetical protein As57867_015110 [Aphanomyces stellatus]VFT91975.1 Aste57867_15166 [Aphanomyces stellatus]